MSSDKFIYEPRSGVYPKEENRLKFYDFLKGVKNSEESFEKNRERTINTIRTLVSDFGVEVFVLAKPNEIPKQLKAEVVFEYLDKLESLENKKMKDVKGFVFRDNLFCTEELFFGKENISSGLAALKDEVQRDQLRINTFMDRVKGVSKKGLKARIKILEKQRKENIKQMKELIIYRETLYAMIQVFFRQAQTKDIYSDRSILKQNQLKHYLGFAYQHFQLGANKKELFELEKSVVEQITESLEESKNVGMDWDENLTELKSDAKLSRAEVELKMRDVVDEAFSMIDQGKTSQKFKDFIEDHRRKNK